MAGRRYDPAVNPPTPASHFRKRDAQVDLPDLERGVLELWDRIDAFRPVGGDAAARVGVQLLRRPALPHRQPALRQPARRDASRTSCPATGRCGGIGWSAVSGGTPTASRWRWRWRRTSVFRVPRTSPSTGSSGSTRPAGGWSRPTPRTGSRSPAGSAAGSTSRTTTRPWTPSSWRASGGSSASSGTGGWSTGTVKVLPYSWGAATPLSNFEANLDYRQVDDPAITVRLAVVEPSGARWPTATGCSSGRRPHGPFPGTWRWRWARTSHTCASVAEGETVLDRREQARLALAAAAAVGARRPARPGAPTWWGPDTSRRSTGSARSATGAPSG